MTSNSWGLATNFERRESTRQVCNLFATCRPFSHSRNDPFLAIAHDISSDGVGLWVRQGVASRTLTVELRDHSGTYSLSKVVRVKRIGQHAAARSCIGGIFVKKLSQEELEGLLGNE